MKIRRARRLNYEWDRLRYPKFQRDHAKCIPVSGRNMLKRSKFNGNNNLLMVFIMLILYFVGFIKMWKTNWKPIMNELLIS